MSNMEQDYKRGVRFVYGLFLFIILLCVLASCDENEIDCVYSKDCPSGYVCIHGTCTVKRK